MFKVVKHIFFQLIWWMLAIFLNYFDGCWTSLATRGAKPPSPPGTEVRTGRNGRTGGGVWGGEAPPQNNEKNNKSGY